MYIFRSIFSLIGVQSFHGSLSRTCVWVNPANSSDTFDNDDSFCGGYLDPETLTPKAYLYENGQPSRTPKGFICPVNSICKSQENPYNGTISFDNFLNSLELVFTIMSLNGFSDIMYDVIDAEYLAASIFFIIGVIILAYGLASLFISVIASSFKMIRRDTNLEEDTELKINQMLQDRNDHIIYQCRTKIGLTYNYLREIPILLILSDIVAKCTLTDRTDEKYIDNVYILEIVTSGILAIEILIRFALYFPKPLFFFLSILNSLDFCLAIANTITIIPAIYHNYRVYRWLTMFQIARFYRVVIAIPFVRDLWTRVLIQVRLIFDITIFYYLFVYLASLLACLLLQGVIPSMHSPESDTFFSFQTLGNSFLGMYVVSTTENWTDILFSAVQAADSTFSRACIAAFFVAWLIMSNFVTLNMFIAVLTDNLEISVSGKRTQQLYMFLKQMLTYGTEYTTQTREGFKMLIFNFIPLKIRNTEYEDILAKIIDIMKESNLKNFLSNESQDKELTLDDQPEEVRIAFQEEEERLKQAEELIQRSLLTSILAPIKALKSKLWKRNMTLADFGDDLERYISYLRELDQHRRQESIMNPKFNKSFGVLSVKSKLRRFCQAIVAPSFGKRLESEKQPHHLIWYTFSTIMFLATIGLIVIAGIVTPIYYQEYVTNQYWNWYVISELAFVILFTIELIIKTIADGVISTPNAYLKSVWGIIDFVVWMTLFANMIQEIFFHGVNSRILRAFKAFRALRLLSFSPKAQELFHSIIIVGIWKLFTAAVVALSLLFPFSVWGLVIFRGRLYKCNDSDFTGSLTGCVGEFANVPFDWEVLSPRTVTNPYFDFNNFGHSFLILFEIISLEGWVDVLLAVMGISGEFTQPVIGQSAEGAFVIIYNTISTIFIVTLFLSVIIQNYARSSGTAYFTDEQRLWYETEKSLRTVRPSIRPPVLREGSLRETLFKQFVTPYSIIQVSMFTCLMAIGIVLMAEFYPMSVKLEAARSAVLLLITVIYLCFILMKVYAFGIRRYFRRKWDLYAFSITVGAFSLKVAGFAIATDDYLYRIFEKLLFLGMLLMIIPHSRRLDQLLKTAAASLPNIMNLLIVWFILYLAFGIAFNQVFGLTRLGPNGSTSINFRTFPNSLVLLFRMSCGEGWNMVLSDYLVQYPNCYENSDNDSDCGSKPYAYILFISWNIISLYIFANLLVSLIYEQFSYLTRPNEPPIDRNKLRQFKEVWFAFDQNSTGYILRDDLLRFMMSLDGYFSMQIHEEPWRLKTIIEENSIRDGDNVDRTALRKALRNYPRDEVLKRKAKCEQFYYHALELSDNEGRISFTQLLLLYPFYNDMDYTQCLNLPDFIHYQMILDTIKKKMEEDRKKRLMLMVKSRLLYNFERLKKLQSRYQEQTGGMSIPTFRVAGTSSPDDDSDNNTNSNPNTTLVD